MPINKIIISYFEIHRIYKANSPTTYYKIVFKALEILVADAQRVNINNFIKTLQNKSRSSSTIFW
jgi:hypothetical protein